MKGGSEFKLEIVDIWNFISDSLQKTVFIWKYLRWLQDKKEQNTRINKGKHWHQITGWARKGLEKKMWDYSEHWYENHH